MHAAFERCGELIPSQKEVNHVALQGLVDDPRMMMIDEEDEQFQRRLKTKL